ncbi:MAG: alpha/beta hydrolase [Pikeienuella sp.]
MAINDIFFATNRRISQENPLEFDYRLYPQKPFFFRVGVAKVEKLDGSPWDLEGEGYEMRSAEIYDEIEPSEQHRDGVPASPRLFAAIQKTVTENPRDVLAFIHGFSSSFESSMCRANELRDVYRSPGRCPHTGDFTGPREPVTFAFSWPSDESVWDGEGLRWAYHSDRDDAAASSRAMARFALKVQAYLSKIDRRARCHQRINLVAHSMGNWAFANAIQSLVSIAEEEGLAIRPMFDNVFLMAADLDAQALNKSDMLGPLLQIAKRIHVYHAANDFALSLSNAKHGKPRLGHDGPLDLPMSTGNVFAVDCSLVSDTPADSHRHQYYRLAPEVISDVRQVLAGVDMDRITGREPVSERKWRIERDAKARGEQQSSRPGQPNRPKGRRR